VGKGKKSIFLLTSSRKFMSSRSSVKAAPEYREGWFSAISPADYKIQQRKIDKARKFERERPRQAGFLLRRDYSEPLPDEELGDLSEVGASYQSGFKKMAKKEQGEAADVTGRVEEHFPSITGEMMAYGDGVNSDETSKAFLDYHYLLGHYQTEVNEEKYYANQREEWAWKNANRGGPGSVQARFAQYLPQFDRRMELYDGGDYEWMNESEDE
jgi:hypothetical protein